MQNTFHNSDQILQQENEENFNLKELLLKYLRHWYWFLISILACSVLAFLYLRYTIPIYEIKSSIMIKDEKKGMSGDLEVLEDLNLTGGSKLVENEIEVLKSRNIIEKVVDKLNLTVTYWHEGSPIDNELYTNSPIKIQVTKYTDKSFKVPFYIVQSHMGKFDILDEDKKLMGTFDYGTSIETSYGKFRVFQVQSSSKFTNETIKVQFSNKDKNVDNLLDGLTAELINPKSTVISLTIPHHLPEKGKAILGSILEEYSFSALDDKNREATSTLRFIEDRLKLVISELGDVEHDVERYRTTKGITDLSAESSLYLETAKDNDSKLNETDIQLKVLDGVERYLQSDQLGNISPSTLLVNDPVLITYLEELSKLELEREKLSSSTQAGNPFLETIQTQMRNVKGAIRETIANQKKGIQITRKSLLDQNNRLEAAISTIPRKEREFVEIKRQAGIKESLYLLLLTKREETALTYASNVTDSRVVDKPFSSKEPVSPKRKTVALIALLLGLIIPASLINLKEMMTDTVQSKKEIEEKTGLTVFGEIGKKDSKDKEEIIDMNSRSIVNEQIRMIRSNLQYLFVNKSHDEAKLILLTSSTASEGKSFVTANLASALGLLNKKVVIIGLDLRKPKINEYLKMNVKLGITHYLIDRATIDDIIYTTTINNVFLIPAGVVPPNPSELIANGKIGTLLEKLKPDFDYIFIDMPPIGLVTDATLMAPYIDTCLYLVRHETTPKHFLASIKELKEKRIFPSMHIIFNAINYNNSSAYGYGKYGKSYYGEENKKNKLWKNKLWKNKLWKK